MQSEDVQNSGTKPESEPLFAFDGTSYIPSVLTRGPWSPDAQHGGPPAGLAAHLLQQFEGGDTMFLARTTVELLRPVPLRPLTARVRLVRPGKKVQLVEASLWANGAPDAAGATEVVRALGLRIRRSAESAQSAESAESAVSAMNDAGLLDSVDSANAEVDARDHMHSTPDDGVASTHEFGTLGFHAEAVELRFVKSSMLIPGPGTMWARLKQPILASAPAVGVPLAVALSDFGNAVSSVVDMEQWSYINADLTVSLHREPVGEWICLDGVTRVSSLGVGQAMTSLHDVEGPIGRASATLLIERR
jgi:Thioesterase-like superfamily